MTRRTAITINVASPGPGDIPALFAPVVEALAEPVVEWPEPESYDWKIPGTWMATAILGELPSDDAQSLVAGLAGRLPLSGWHFSGDEDVADAVWAADDDPREGDPPFPGVTWILIQASHPPVPGAEPAETEDLVPLIPEGLTDADIAEIVEFLTDENGGQARKPGEP
jgi:hypothetical protein